MFFLEIISADIVFKFCRYTHIRINRWRGTITFKCESKGAKCSHAPTRPKMAQNWHIPRYNKKTKQLLSIKVCSLLFVRP